MPSSSRRRCWCAGKPSAMVIGWCLLLMSCVERRRILTFAFSVRKIVRHHSLSTRRPNMPSWFRSCESGAAGSAIVSLFLATQGPEPSLMPDYITDFLLKQRQIEALSNPSSSQSQEGTSSSSFLIAVPMEDSHDLLLELESVQRAVLYHCPLLVHACLVPAQIRLPLLYVHTTSSSTSASARDLRQLTRLVQNIVQEEMFAKSASCGEDDGMESGKALQNDDMSSVYREVNADGILPLVMTFQSLQTAGRNHQELYTVGKIVEESQRHRLSKLVSRLQQAVESLGWTTSLTSSYEKDLEDPNQSSQDGRSEFEARVPFMRLPTNFESFLEPTPDDQDPMWRTSEQGGNGISPIFWCQWWEDVFARDVRLRQIGIYPQQPPPLSTQQDLQQLPQQKQSPEEEFHVPFELIPLPSGNAALAVRERQEQVQQQERLMQQFQKLQEKSRPMKNANARDNDVDVLEQEEDAALLVKTQNRLESLYQQQELTPIENDEAIVDGDVDLDDDSILLAQMQASLPKPVPSSTPSLPSSEAPIDDWTRERIRNVVEARSRNKFGNQEDGAGSKRKDLPPIEENSIFLKYKEGSLVNEESPYFAMQQQAPKRPLLPPYPSREHFIGIWRAVTPPTGFPEETGETTKSDNLILRVDGTTAGGPILDYEQQQKAAGGTWRLLENESEDAGMRLRIRLVIPPQKERILVMEGEVTRISMTPSDLPLTTSTFGIPALEERLEKSKEEQDDMLHCAGEVWIEDAVTGNNRNEIGSFSLMKISSPSGDPRQFTVTIPRPVRNQD